MNLGVGAFSKLLALAFLMLLEVNRKAEAVLLSKQNYGASEDTCDPKKEYRYEWRCCLYCPPGTHVVQHCIISHTFGICQDCPSGKYSLKNNLKTCQQCTKCQKDQEMLIPCYKNINTKCQCKEGYYCDAPNCKVCQPCTERCPEGQRILQRCNTTADILCGVPTTGMTFKFESSAARAHFAWMKESSMRAHRDGYLKNPMLDSQQFRSQGARGLEVVNDISLLHLSSGAKVLPPSQDESQVWEFKHNLPMQTQSDPWWPSKLVQIEWTCSSSSLDPHHHSLGVSQNPH